jgi:hypothetical protein
MSEVLATVRDTVNPASMKIDDSYQGVLAYRDGLYRWPAAQAKRFHDAGKRIYPISVEGANAHLAQVVDCENGDLSPAEAAHWVRLRNELHHDATVYASLDTIWEAKPSLLDELGNEPCWLWVAWWTGKPQVPGRFLPPNIRIAAIQYQGLPDWDLSAIVSREWPASPYNNIADW